MGNKFVGREEEIEIFDKYCKSDKNELVAIYGRRRVGKTYLVRETIGDILDFSFTGIYKESAKNQRMLFQKEINNYTKKKVKTPSDWYETFDNLKEYLLSLNKERVIIFIDELPWMDTPKSDFLNAFTYFWNNWGKEKVILKLIVCGSATTWMVNKLIGDKGGLYGRVTRPIYLAPFTLAETEKFLNTIKRMDFGRKQVLDTYMILGGIPYYLDMLDRDLPLSINIDRLLFAENAPLRTEYEFIFRSLFNDSVRYKKVIEALSTKLMGLQREEIAEICGFNGGELTNVLKNLNACDFIRSYSTIGKKERDKIYQLTDMYSLFYLRFVKGETGQDERYWTNLGSSGKKNAWEGYAFEQVCLHHIRQIKEKLGISGILSNVYAWSQKPFVDKDGTKWKGGQIDLIIDRNDSVMNLCEMKYSQDEYVIEKEYEKILSDRISLFKSVSKTKKDLRCTFVTLHGIKPNKHSGIVNNSVTLDDLFR